MCVIRSLLEPRSFAFYKWKGKDFKSACRSSIPVKLEPSPKQMQYTQYIQTGYKK